MEQLSLQLRKYIAEVFVWTVECCIIRRRNTIITKEWHRMLEAFETWIWHCVLKISWQGHKTKEEVLTAVETRNELIDILTSRQKRWRGHVLQHVCVDCLVTTVLEGRLQGKKGRGRLLSWLLKTEERNIDYAQLEELAQDRSKWRQVVLESDTCPRRKQQRDFCKLPPEEMHCICSYQCSWTEYL